MDSGAVVTEERAAAVSAVSSVRVERISTPPGGLVEYRPAAPLVSVVTGAPRWVELVTEGGPTRRVEVIPGRVHVFPVGVPVGLRLFGPAENIVVALSPALISAEDRSQRIELRLAFAVEDALIAQLVYAMESAVATGRPHGRYVRLLASALGAHLASSYAAAEDARHRPPLRLSRPAMQSVVHYIDEHVEDELSLQRLAGVARLSVFAFARRFKAVTGVPPHQYVLRRRVERAKELLGGTRLGVADVALRCGFGDQSAFTTAFRRLTRQTPTAFRETLRGRC
jgi:AraC family transcriptional regulator